MQVVIVLEGNTLPCLYVIMGPLFASAKYGYLIKVKWVCVCVACIDNFDFQGLYFSYLQRTEIHISSF